MKKNVMMRLACFLLVAVLISTSAISGTYAKYVTSDTGADVARVAKFGVKVDIAAASNFSNEYKTNTSVNGDTTALSVKSVDDAKVVAPGTSSDDVDGDFTFAITGKPEVATRIDIEMVVNHDIYLGANTYEDPTTADTDSFELNTTYYPVVFTLKDSKDTVIAEGNLKKIAEEFNKKSAEYLPNQTLDETYTLTWKWEFERGSNVSEKATYNAADTLLGNLAANAGWGVDKKDEYEYDLNIDFGVKITVTQID